MSESASRAFSIPDALSAAALRSPGPSSSCDRSSVPREGFWEEDLALPLLGFEGREASSAAAWASRSAFLRAASAFLASASSLLFWDFPLIEDHSQYYWPGFKSSLLRIAL